MKILSVDQIRNLDEFTIRNEPILSIDLMERAADAFCKWYIDNIESSESAIFCGIGNNGGDGLAIARILLSKGYKVSVFVVGDIEKGSPDFKINWDQLEEKPNLLTDDFPIINNETVIIDAIFGSGLTRTVEGLFAEVINKINTLPNLKISVDIPSGLFADKFTHGNNIIEADHTISFQLPKLTFMFPHSFKYVGEWHMVDIGLSENFIESANTKYNYLIGEELISFLKPLRKFDHKGSNGNALLVVGAYGKIGAAVLAAKAAIKTGVGLLTVQLPECGNTIIQIAVPEAMTLPDKENKHIAVYFPLEKYTAIGIGSGLGMHVDTFKVLRQILENAGKPIVIDADALNMISENKELLEIVPKNSILTPHPKEFERLVGIWANDFERLEKQKEMARHYEVIVVLKGAHTSIVFPDGEVYFNSTGNPGMAKGGSGDVLLGMITSLLAQGYSSKNAALLGVFLHGSAGDLAQEFSHIRSMSASDIIDCIPHAYHQF